MSTSEPQFPDDVGLNNAANSVHALFLNSPQGPYMAIHYQNETQAIL